MFLNFYLINQDNKWYFWDEVWADTYGPYNTEKEARSDLDWYVDFLLNGLRRERGD